MHDSLWGHGITIWIESTPAGYRIVDWDKWNIVESVNARVENPPHTPVFERTSTRVTVTPTRTLVCGGAFGSPPDVATSREMQQA